MLLPALERLPVPEIAPLIVMFPEVALITPVEELPNAMAILIVWALAELLLISPLTMSAVPPLAPADPAFAASV